MKLLTSLALLMALIAMTSFTAMAQEGEHKEVAVKADAKKEAKMAAREAYKKAKQSCLVENKDLKGKDLKDCIVKKQTEAK